MHIQTPWCILFTVALCRSPMQWSEYTLVSSDQLVFTRIPVFTMVKYRIGFGSLYVFYGSLVQWKRVTQRAACLLGSDRSSSKLLFRLIIKKIKIKILHTGDKKLFTDADSSTNTKKILLVNQNSLKNFFLHGNLTPFLSKSFQI